MGPDGIDRSVAVNRIGAASMETVFNFGSGKSGNECLLTGWCEPEDGFVWSEGRLSLIRLPAMKGKNLVSLSLWGYAPDGVHQDAIIFCNGLLKGLYEIDESQVVTVSVDRLHVGEDLEIAIYLPTSRSPHDAEGSTDLRRLGIALALIQQSSVST